MIALASGILPFLVGGAWLASNLLRASSVERHAFAWLATTMVVVLTFEVASFNARFGGGIVRERYLFYLVPLFLVALFAAFTDVRLPRWSLAVPIVVLCGGFLAAPLPSLPEVQRRHTCRHPEQLADRDVEDSRHRARVPDHCGRRRRTRLHRGGRAAGPGTNRDRVTALLLVALPAETAYAFNGCSPSTAHRVCR